MMNIFSSQIESFPQIMILAKHHSYDQGLEEKVVQDSLDELFDDEELENKLDLKK